MSIRKKLLLSYIAMIVVPIVVFAGTGAILVSLVINNQIGPATVGILGDVKSMKEFRANLVQLSEWEGGLKFIAEHEPQRLEDESYLREIEETLTTLEMAIVVEKNAAPVYVSPWFGSGYTSNELMQALHEGGEGWNDNELELGGNLYSADKKEFIAQDGSDATLYVIQEDRISDTARWLFFAVLAFVVLVVAGTNGFLTFLVSRSIIKPLHQLKAAAEEIKDGNLDYELAPRKKDEIGKVGESFEEMRLRLKASIQAELQAEENRKQLLANISHDLKTPITAIIACTEGLRDGIASSEEKRQQYIGMIYGKATHMDGLIEELFLYSKLDLKRLPFYFEELDLNAFLEAYVKELGHHPQYQNVQLTYEGPAHAVLVEADREKLGRILNNITSNSVKHLDKAEKTIHFSLQEHQQNQEVEITVSDNGRGIGKEALPLIFDRFYRTDASRSTDTGGSGLGLAIVKQMVEAHGGMVEARSVQGEGTSIHFTLITGTKEKGERHDEAIDH
ncbi:sensor histidine kinase [Aureibacillus halotolerans]|uniref:histidine kinase n=1 Tax=Aureibacillus halotolerans TaxID=1508390 RepID=A0A4R6TXJ8_9BACI|nr:HAMP domain-containing sensor histidine kinase [Aureibacillus halotolerans]TDQ36595.1 signal transduction histidine kinase [Aureibacillus halotolerans]